MGLRYLAVAQTDPSGITDARLRTVSMMIQCSLGNPKFPTAGAGDAGRGRFSIELIGIKICKISLNFRALVFFS